MANLVAEEENSILDSFIDISQCSTPRCNKNQSNLRDKLQTAIKQNRKCYSFEYFPPQTQEGLMNLADRIRRMGLTKPLWVDITHSKHSKTMDLAKLLLEYSSVDILVHLSMTDQSKKEIIAFCNELKDFGIRNILCIRGDPPRGCDTWVAVDDELQHCADMVRLIRDEFGRFFSIFVGGYPEGHHNAPSLDQDILYLKQKIEAGADAVITQLFYDTKKFFEYVEKCRANGISVPIIPGIMPMQTYSTFVRVVSFSNVTVPDKVWDDLEPIKDNDEKVKNYGIEYTVQMCKEIMHYGINILHFYTFNLERSVSLTLERLDLYSSENCDEENSNFPWIGSKCQSRKKQESVRPIFWANRSESYLQRTAHWDEYPNGRWGDARSPAYGEFIDHYLFRQQLPVLNRKQMWGHAQDIKSIEDISNVFISYLNEEIEQLPWCNERIRAETMKFLLDPLKLLNKNGFLTINSQPQVNGAPSNEPVVGWGKANGFVYQKAYLEFFCSKSVCEKLIQIINNKKNSNYATITYQAINQNSKFYSNCQLDNVNAVTWGVFPNCEILQPTVVDPHSFIAWKDEAFGLWKSLWQSIYEKDSSAYGVIETVCNDWFLVNIVENNYICGNIFAPFVEYFQESDHDDIKEIESTFVSSLQEQQQMWCCLQKYALHDDVKRENSNDVKSRKSVVVSKSKLGDATIAEMKNPYLDESLLHIPKDSS